MSVWHGGVRTTCLCKPDQTLLGASAYTASDNVLHLKSGLAMQDSGQVPLQVTFLYLANPDLF